MPYATNADLPPAIRTHLPTRAQDHYREVFNHAWMTYAHASRREEIAHRVAWAAVKRRYHKDPDGQWRINAVDASARRYERRLGSTEE